MRLGASLSFSAPYDLTTKAISAGIWVIPLVVVVAVRSATMMVFAAGLWMLISFLVYAYSPRGYVISGGAVTVRRLIGDVEVPLENVLEVRRAVKDDLRWCIRLWGSGGLFGYYGLYRTAKLGLSRWYVTDRSRIVIVKTEAQTALFSPDDVDGFMGAIETKALDPVDPPWERPGHGGAFFHD